MTIWDVLVGQDDTVAMLSRAAADAAADDVSHGSAMTHAWLLTGPPGAGRSTAALAFAAALMCPQQGCGHCEVCQSVLHDTHADVFRYATSRTQIPVDDVRDELVPLAARFPSYGQYRVLIVEDADRLNDYSGNALLKAIEEPTPHSVWVLCAPSTVDVLPTIRSRCQVVSLRTPPWRDVAALLESRDGIDPAMAAFAARVSQGHVGRAKALATDEAARLRRQEVLRLPMSLHDLPSCFAAAADVVAAATEDATSWTDPLDVRERDEVLALHGSGATGKGMSRSRTERVASAQLKDLAKEQKARLLRAVRDRLDRSMLDLMSFYRDVLMLQLGIDTDLVNEELRPVLAQVAGASTAESTRRRLEAIARTRVAFDSNAAPQLLLESLTVELARP